ncbi:MAG: STAS domain-containing protein [Methylovulum sp.]|nr:STAS domain-containing protein [Methylovulum sp.]
MSKNDETENDKNNLIGYDPLAWMDQEVEDYAKEEIEVLQQSIMADDNVLESNYSNQSLQDADENDDANYNQSPVHLDAALSIQNVSALHEKLKKVLTANDYIEINLSDVASIDTATLQLLVALKKDSVKLQKTVVFNSPSPRFIESAKLLGLLEILDV